MSVELVNPLRAGPEAAATGTVCLPISTPARGSPPKLASDTAPPAQASGAARAASARCQSRTLFLAGLLVGAVVAGLSVRDFIPRVRDIVTIRDPLPFPLPLFFQNLTLPEGGDWS